MKKDRKNSFEFDGIIESDFGKGDFHHPDALTTDEILKDGGEASTLNSALDSLLKKVTSATNKQEQPNPEPTLLDKCLPYIIDDEGNDISQNEKPLYELETVAQILKKDSQKTLEKLSKEYSVVFENPPVVIDKTEKYLSDEPEKEETNLTQEPKEKPKEESQYPIISDIDITDSPFYKIKNNEAAKEQTVTFTPIENAESNTSKIIVNSHTRAFDFTGEMLKIKEPITAETEEVRLEKSEFEEYTPKAEFTDATSGRVLLKRFAKAKINGFFAMWGSILMTLLTAFFMLPFMSNIILTHTRGCMIITSVFSSVAVVLNIKCFAGLRYIFNRKANSDIGVCLAIIGVAVYSVLGITQGEIILNMQLLLLIILSFNGIKSFMTASSLLRSFKQILGDNSKNSVSLISDPAITLAMTKGAVSGDCLIAAPQSTNRVCDFIKYSTFGVFLNGKVNIITAVSLLLAVLTGILAGVFFGEPLYGSYAAAAVLCLTSAPMLFLVDALPFYHSAKKLAKKGAMIAGKTGAELIEEANAVVINAKDIFPSGTVTLHQMKVLSENNLEDIILRAASLTDSMQSPLAPIFKKIAGNSNITVFPDSDTVKYEEALGISGWVDNRLLFIGNRTLMEAHGISVPNVELDRKILRQGFFPVYVASANKACALLVVRYDVSLDVSRELRRLTNSGVTLLVKTSDPNITEAMVCDYLGLYEDTVKVMTAAGCHIYVNTVAPVKSISAPAAFKTNPSALPAILNCAGKIKRANIILTAAYIISAVFGVLMFSYASFGGSGSLLSDSTLLLYSILSTALTYLLYLTQKP
ncbi:MAG: cation-translocating P-type ATPase [Clostridia bacterium]|nr:cation-translocating P-type ATPase [Clostridia bacterium]